MCPRVGAHQLERPKGRSFCGIMIDMVKFTIITLFREALEPYLNASVNLRDFGLGPHKSVDDTPYGGGDGMLLMCEPVFNAIESVKSKDPTAKVILPTPVGEIWNQAKAKEMSGVALARAASGRPVCLRQFASQEASATGGRRYSSPCQAPDSLGEQTPDIHYIILCPHYEGYDERILSIVDYQISLGKFVLTGGELPALVIIDSIVRLIPGVLGGEKSAEIESFSDGDNLEYPQYTKPYDFRGMKVPDILLSGNHGEVDKWRAEHTRHTASGDAS